MLTRGALCGAALLLAVCSAFAVMIDDFENPTAVHSLAVYAVPPPPGPNPQYGSDTGLPLGSTIGGIRSYKLEYIGGGSAGDQTRARLVGISPNQRLSFSNDSAIQSELELTYGGDGIGTNPPPLNANLSATTDVEIAVASADQPSTVLVEAWSDIDGTPGYAFAFAVIPAGSSFLVTIPVSSFSGTVDGSDIDIIRFTFGLADDWTPRENERRYASDLQLSLEHLQTLESVIPEPCSLTLIALGGLGLLRRRRRK